MRPSMLRWERPGRGILRHLQQRGLIRADLNPEIEATTLLCMFGGVGVHAAIDPERLNAKRTAPSSKPTSRGWFADLHRRDAGS